MQLTKYKYDSFFWSAGAIFLLTAFSSAYLNTFTPISILLGIGFTAFIALRPKFMFWILLFSIPLSIEYNTPWNFGTDFPDEFFMLGLTFLSPLLLGMSDYERLKKFLVHPISLLLIFQILWSVCTLLYSTHVVLSTKFVLSKIWYIIPFVYLSQLALYKDSDLKTIVWAIILPCMLVAIYALYNHYHLNFTFVSINDAVYPFYRNHVNYAATLSFGFSVAIIVFWYTPHSQLKFILGIILLILLVAIFFSFTRGTWLSILLSAIGLWLFIKRKIYVSIILTGCIVVGSFIGMIINDNYLILKPDFDKTIVHSSLSDHLSSMYSMHEISGSERLHRWVAGVRMIAEKPLQGFGPACFYSEYKPYTDSRFKTWVSGNPEKSSVHNYFLLIWIEQGLIGFVLFILLIFYFFHRCHRIYFATNQRLHKQIIEALILVMCNLLVVNFFSDMIETDKVGTIFFLCLGILMWIDGQFANQNNKHELDKPNSVFADKDSLV